MAGGRERTSVEVRLVTPDDASGLTSFFRALPEGDRSFFREDVTSADVVAKMTAGTEARSGNHRLVALVDDTVVGYAAVLARHGWSRHVGELRIATAPDFRQRGIGRLLAQRVVVEARHLGLEKLVVDVVAGQDRLFDMFTRLGFEQEGRLRAHVRSTTGETRDLLVLAHFVDKLSEDLASDRAGS